VLQAPLLFCLSIKPLINKTMPKTTLERIYANQIVIFKMLEEIKSKVEQPNSHSSTFILTSKTRLDAEANKLLEHPF
jgi:hypothetical protein